jgi:hypothetical protein
MKKLIPLLGLILALCPLAFANAANRSESTEEKSPTGRTWEIAAESTAGFTIHKDKSTNADTVTTWGGEVGASYFVMPQLEVGATFGYIHYSQSDTSSHAFQLLVGPTFNFSDDPENAVFLSAAIGEETSGSSTTYLGTSYTASTSQFAWSLNLGKRFHLADHVSWAPQAGIIYVGESDYNTGSGISGKIHSTTDWQIVPFRFTVLL